MMLMMFISFKETKRKGRSSKLLKILCNILLVTAFTFLLNFLILLVNPSVIEMPKLFNKKDVILWWRKHAS